MPQLLDVSPRDGLQNEKREVATADKLALIRASLAMGFRRIEVTSFVNPRRVPQMADAEAVCAGLPEAGAGAGARASYIGLVLNRRGAERALATGRLHELGAVAVAADAFAMANQGQPAAATVAEAEEIVAAARAGGLIGQVTIATAFGCPFSGEVAPDTVVAMAARLAAAQPAEIALADTIGVAGPAEVAALCRAVRAEIGAIPLRVHFHNTRGTGLANVWAAVEAGAATIDVALGGIGGCPFAPGAAGNVAAEDVAYMLGRCGIDTGLDLGAMVDTSHWLGGVIGRQLPGMVARAPAFPPPAGAWAPKGDEA